MIFIAASIFLILGLIIGSFLNVVIFRLNTGKSLGGRSGCMSCQNQLSWYELIPVISFIALSGRCRNCKVKISIQYPLVELATGVVFALLFLKLQNFSAPPTIFTIMYAYYAFVFALLIVIAAYDIKHKIIPDTLAALLAVLAFVGLFLLDHNGFGIFFLHVPSLHDFLAGAVISLPFALVWLLSSGTWMGLGDAKLAVGLGWFLGFAQMLTATVLAFWSGAIIGLALLVLNQNKKYGMKTEISFAPYLVLGALLTLVFSLQLFPI